MGIETAIILAVASTALGAMNTMKQASQQAKAVVKTANINAMNKAKQTALKAGAQQTSFLNSGLTLEGTPMGAISETFKTGLEDIELIRSNANTESKNIMSNARMQVFQSILSTGASVAGGSVGGYSKGSFSQNLSSDIKSVFTTKTGKVG